MPGTITTRTTIPLALAGAMVLALLGLAGAWYSARTETSVALRAIEARVDAQADTTARQERAIAEVRNEAASAQRGTEAKLIRIEDKLDRLIERLSAGPRR